MPPNILRFLDGGLAEPGRWRVPLVLRLDSSVTADAVRAVLTAVVNHHDALRMRVVNRAGVWEQQIGEPGDFTDLTERRRAELSPGGYGIHWPLLDEDLSIGGLWRNMLPHCS